MVTPIIDKLNNDYNYLFNNFDFYTVTEEYIKKKEDLIKTIRYLDYEKLSKEINTFQNNKDKLENLSRLFNSIQEGVIIPQNIQPLYKSCQYGISCYRKNAFHKFQYHSNIDHWTIPFLELIRNYIWEIHTSRSRSRTRTRSRGGNVKKSRKKKLINKKTKNIKKNKIIYI